MSQRRGPDANDVLKTQGPAALVESLARAKPVEVPAATQASTPAPASTEPHSSAVASVWEWRLSETDKGYKASASNVELILENHPAWSGQLRYDARSNQIVIEPGAPIVNGDRARVYLDDDDSRLSIWFERSKYAITIAPNSAHLHGTVCVVAKQRTFDPVRDWLDTLRWDKKPRIDRWAVEYLGAKDEPITCTYGRCWLISGAARVYEPGCQVDHTLVLVGAQGAGKSSALRIIAVRPAWYTDSLPSLNDKKAAAEILQGRWIIEHGELDTLKRAELSTAKAWLTAQEDRFRAAYARKADSHPRRCIFAATTNEDSFLVDATGNRRFWPVTVRSIDLKALERDREQLWAEAVHRHHAGEPWHFTDPSLIAAAHESQQERFQVDAWEPVIEAFLDRSLTNAGVTIGEVLKGAFNLAADKWDQISQNRAARCLQHLGLVRRQRREDDGKRSWVYRKVDGDGEL